MLGNGLIDKDYGRHVQFSSLEPRGIAINGGSLDIGGGGGYQLCLLVRLNISSWASFFRVCMPADCL